MKYGELNLGQVEAIVNKLGGMDGVHRFLSGEPVVAAGKNKLLRLIFGDENFVIDATDGTEILAKANDVFNYIDSDFIAYGADEQGSATPETSTRVYEMVKDATFAQMFGSLSNYLDKLCFTQAQIKGFVKNHRKCLRADGYATFFLFKSRDHFFVAFVSVRSGGELRVGVARFECSRVWYAEDRPRVVVPQLA